MSEEAGGASGAANAPTSSGTMLKGNVSAGQVKLVEQKAKFDYSNVNKKQKAGTSKTGCGKKKKKQKKKKTEQPKKETPKAAPVKPATPKFDTSKFPGKFGRGTIDAWANDPKGFSRLKNKPYEVMAEYNADDHSPSNHNCIDDSVEDSTKRIPPQTGPKDDPFGPMDKIYKSYGYKPYDTTNPGAVPGTKKVILYATKNPDGSIKAVTHAFRQLPDGTWRSKMGYGPVIRIDDPADLSSDFYGVPVRVYAK